MVDNVAPTPPLPPPPHAADLYQLHHWDADLSKALILYLSDLARRTNASFIGDGTGVFTGNLNMGGFNITNVGDLTVTDDITGLDGFFTNLTVSGTVAGSAFGVFVLIAGSTMTGKLVTRTPASGGGTAGLNLPPGSSPDAGDLVNGDLWIVGNSVLVRLGGATRQLMHTNASSAWTAKQTFVTPTTGTASINLPHGTAPTTPVDGDTWTTTSGFFGRVNGVTRTLSAGLDILSLAPSANQNDYNIGMNADATVRTHANIAPTNSIKITGISATGVVAGKTITFLNTTSRTGASGRIILFERLSSASTAANRIDYAGNRKLPLILMPGEAVDLVYDGTNWRAVKPERPLTLNGFFDQCFHGIVQYSAWTSGAGATSTYGGQSTDANGDPYNFLSVSTGTTTTGRSSMTTSDTATHRFGTFAQLQISQIEIPTLSDATEEFDVHVGFIESNTFTDEIGWHYDRNTNTDWLTRTASNAVVTSTDSNLAVTAGNTPILGTFVNGDGSRADFFYSDDNGATWTFTTAHTTNIPTGTSRLTSSGVCVIKSAGTTSRQINIIFSGNLGWA